jgi:hypothetical protein
MLGFSHEALAHEALVQVVDLRLPERFRLSLHRVACRLQQTPFAVAPGPFQKYVLNAGRQVLGSKVR